MSRRVREWLKTGLIAVLLVSAVLLGFSSDVFSGLAGAFSQSQVGTSDPGAAGVALSEAARPVVIVLTNQSAGRAVFKYDMDALDLIYENTSSSMGEALVALPSPEACSEAQ